MKYFSFKLLILCMCLPPLGYSGGVYLLEYTLERHYISEIESVYLGDPNRLMDGEIEIKKAVNQHIEKYLSDKNPFNNGINIHIRVVTKAGDKIYPAFFDDVDRIGPDKDRIEVASHNYRLMNDGLQLIVSVSLEQNSLISAVIFFSFLLSALVFIYLRYNAAIRRELVDENEKKREILLLRKLEMENTDKLSNLLKERTALQDSVNNLREKENKSSKNEEGMLDEVIRLENELDENLTSQQVQQDEILKLNEEIEKLKYGKKKVGRHKAKVNDKICRRFRALYKNIAVHERAIDGYNDLEEDLKLKCEEIIFKLNEAPDTVNIKRKVFGRKGRETVLEVIFAYKGRLYFRNHKDGKVEVLAIGTKNSQDKELQFLDRL